MSFFSKIFVRRASDGTDINPAQEDGNLADLAAVDFATETTLGLINTEVGVISGTLTDGTQKTQITDGTDAVPVIPLTDSTTNIDGLNAFVTASALFGRVSDTVVKLLRLDASTESLMTIDYAHHEIHDGTSFWVDDVVQVDNAATQDYLITTPDTTKYAHWGYEVNGTVGGITIELFEAADRTGTTALTLLNRNRNSATTATLAIHRGQSGGTTDGTRILWATDGTGTAAGKESGKVGEGTERVLKRNTKYIFRITSKVNDNDIAVRFNWYEHADRQ